MESNGAEPEDRWWPVQSLPKTIVRTEPRAALQMMIQSVAGLAALERPEMIPSPSYSGPASPGVVRPAVIKGQGISRTLGALAVAAAPAPVSSGAHEAERSQLRLVPSRKAWTPQNIAAAAMLAAGIVLLVMLLWPEKPPVTTTSVPAAPAAPISPSQAAPAQVIEAATGGESQSGAQIGQPPRSTRTNSPTNKGVSRTNRYRVQRQTQPPSDTAGGSTKSSNEEVFQKSEPAGVITIPAGTDVTVRTIDSINSDHAEVGQEFNASVDVPVVVGDRVLVPKGADATLELTGVKKSGHFRGRSELSIQLLSLKVHGRSYQVRAELHDVQSGTRGADTAKKMGGGAALGALIGGILGAGKGALAGATIGAGGAAAYQVATHGPKIKIPSETKISFLLSDDLTMN